MGEVDPRSRGADAHAAHRRYYGQGRSPLTRGRPRVRQEWRQCDGSIPAHAGQTPPCGTGTTPGTVDPRSRGADWAASSWACSACGRSPLTRGRPRDLTDFQVVRRSIPAHAGQTVQATGRRSRRGVDPRSRGADRPTSGRWTRGRGRSPLTRGRRGQRLLQLGDGGSIPAHAGQTGHYQVGLGGLKVDPRSRGADSNSGGWSGVASGRSPLTRGRPIPGRRAGAYCGSIPAHAGQTALLLALAHRDRVDPRSRGADISGPTAGASA